MIDRSAIEQILAQYEKHGWAPRRVLLSDGFRERVPGAEDLFSDLDVRSSGLDAIWFSRSSRPGATAWEIRRLTDAPFALVVVVDDDAGPEEAEHTLGEAESRMFEASNNPLAGH